MAHAATVPAIVLKVQCGQVLNTTINGMPVQIECSAPPEEGGFKPPPPPSGAGGVVAYATMAVDTPLLDLDAVVAAAREERLSDEAIPLGDVEGATVLFEAEDGSVASLDTMVVKGPDS